MTRRRKWITATAAATGAVLVAVVVVLAVLANSGSADGDKDASGPSVTVPEGSTAAPVSPADQESAEQARADTIAESGVPATGGESSAGDTSVGKDIPAGGDLPDAAVTGAILDTTDSMIELFAWNASTMNQIDHGEFVNVTATKDECLLDWAMTALPAADGTWRIASETVCGRDAAVLVGGAGSTNFNLLGSALESPAMKKILLNAGSLAYASVGTSDGSAVLFVAARPAI
jgi:hypothetical protein